MKKWVAIAIVLISGLILVGIASANPSLSLLWEDQCPGLGSGQAEARISADNVQCWVEATPVPDTPVAPTDTPIPPTDTPIPPTGHDSETFHALWNGPSEPFAGAPSCQSMSDTDCHWNHTHNADPSQLDPILGPVGSLYGGQSISYPWQTWRGLDGGAPPAEGNMENDFKHEGYKWMVRQDGSEGDCIPDLAENCITHFRIQQHAVGGQLGALGRFHSYLVEARLCTPDESVCGIVKTGGHDDFGILQVPQYANYTALPDDPPEFVDCTNQRCPYRGHLTIVDAEARQFVIDSLWNLQKQQYGFNAIATYALISGDDWGGIDPDDPTGPMHFVCPDFDCEFNHSTLLPYVLSVTVSSNLDTDGDGVVDFSGFTDRKGNVVADCSPLGPDCIPLEISGAPVGKAGYGPSGRYEFKPSDFWAGSIPYEEYDLSPPGEWWIEFPN